MVTPTAGVLRNQT